MNTSLLYCTHCGAANPDDATTCFACAQPLAGADTLAADLSTKPLLKGRYRLLVRLGAGGFGAVYRAEDTGLGNRVVAIKEMTQSGLKVAELAEAAKAFQREAYLLAGLNHPNLPYIYDHFKEAGRWYLVMEFIEGQTLETLLARAPAKRLPISDVLKIGLQLANVLDYLHTNQPPIIFRDLKPANVMLTATGQAYLIDFGIARIFKPGQAKDTLIIGTPGYLAPEGYGKAQTTPRSDIYSLGATLHHLLSGSEPSDRPFFFAPLQPPVPAPLRALIARMVQMEEKDRPASMAEVKAGLSQIADDGAFAPPTTAWAAADPEEKQRAAPKVDTAQEEPFYTVPTAEKPVLLPPPPAQISPGITRRAVVIGLGAVLLGGAVWTVAHAVAPQSSASAVPTPAPTDVPFQPPTPAPTPPPTVISGDTTVYQIYRGHTGLVFAVAWSPVDGTTIASASQDTTTRIWNANSLRTLVTHHGMVSQMAWSPNGRYIATSGAPDEKIYVWQASNGASQSSYSNNAQGDMPPLAWSPDGRLLAASDDSFMIHIWNVANSQQVASFSGGAGGVLALAWHPDGARILAGNGFPNNSISLWNAQNGTSLASYTGHASSVTALAWSPDGQFFASGSLDNTVCVWNINNNTAITVFKGHLSLITSLAWSPDGKRIASASSDGTVQLWDAMSGNNIFVYRGHSAGVTSVSWSRKNNRIASGGLDNTVQIWAPKP
jgi:predicted Ser/Thr protein kinase